MNSRSRIYSTRILHATITMTLTITLTMTTTGQRQRQRHFTTFFFFFLFSLSSNISGGGGVHAFTSSSPSSPSSLSSIVISQQQQQQQTRRRNVNVGFGRRNTAATCSTWRNSLSSPDSGLRPSLYSSSSTNQDDDDESNSSTEEEKEEEEKKDTPGGRILAIQSQQLQIQKEITAAVAEEQEEITNIDIPALRNEIRRLANIRSSNNAPQDATIALRKMFQSYYYYYHNNNTNSNNKRHKRPGRSGTMNVRDCTQVIDIWVKSRSPTCTPGGIIDLN